MTTTQTGDATTLCAEPTTSQTTPWCCSFESSPDDKQKIDAKNDLRELAEKQQQEHK